MDTKKIREALAVLGDLYDVSLADVAREELDDLEQRAITVSLRDTFAAAALTGMLAGGLKNPEMHGRFMYQIADAMLAAREGK